MKIVLIDSLSDAALMDFKNIMEDTNAHRIGISIMDKEHKYHRYNLTYESVCYNLYLRNKNKQKRPKLPIDTAARLEAVRKEAML